MSRGIIQGWRPLAVWLGVTAAAAAAGASIPGAWAASAASVGADRVADLLVACCATALTAALGWLWVITTSTVAGLALGRARSGGGTTRRLVLLACGAAVAVGTTVPAQAAGGDGAELLAGLSLPERAVARAPAATQAASRATDTYVVRAGDSLWSIAREHPGSDGDVDARWRAIWAANRAVVGDDPDLIHPGQALRLPGATTPTHEPTRDTDGAR